MVELQGPIRAQAGSTGTEKHLKSAFSWRSEESPEESHGPGSETDGAENSQHGLSWYQHFLGNLCLVNMKIKKINNKVVCEARGYDWGSMPPSQGNITGLQTFLAWGVSCVPHGRGWVSLLVSFGH